MSILDKVMDFNIRQVVNKTTPEIKKGAGKLASIMLSASRKLEEVPKPPQ